MVVVVVGCLLERLSHLLHCHIHWQHASGRLAAWCWLATQRRVCTPAEEVLKDLHVWRMGVVRHARAAVQWGLPTVCRLLVYWAAALLHQEAHAGQLCMSITVRWVMRAGRGLHCKRCACLPGVHGKVQCSSCASVQAAGPPGTAGSLYFKEGCQVAGSQSVHILHTQVVSKKSGQGCTAQATSHLEVAVLAAGCLPVLYARPRIANDALRTRSGGRL